MTQKQYSLADVIELQKHQGLSEEEVKEKLEAASLQPIPELRISEEEYRQVFGDLLPKNTKKRGRKDTPAETNPISEKTHSIDSAKKQVQEATSQELNWQQFIQILTATGLDNQDTFSEVEVQLLTTTCQNIFSNGDTKNLVADSILAFEDKLFQTISEVASKRAEDYAIAIEKLIEQTTIGVMSRQQPEAQLAYFQTTDEALTIVEGKSPLNLGSGTYLTRTLPRSSNPPLEESEATIETNSQ